MTKRIKNKLQSWLAIFIGQNLSLHRKFTKENATATIHFFSDDKLGGSIKLDIGGIVYYFEGNPKLEEYKNLSGETVIQKTLDYGGWEMNLKDRRNRVL